MKKKLFSLLFVAMMCSLSAYLSEPLSLFENKTDGYVLYRIPSIVALPGNKLVAFTEARGEGITDCAENDLVCKISEDAGVTWSENILIASAGLASLNNPTTIFLPELNRILMMYQSYPPSTFEATVASGVDSHRTTRVWTIYSDDGGYTWSEPKDVTAQAKTDKMSAVASGPGAIIRIDGGEFEGRLVVPFASTGMRPGWFNYLVYSDDNGESWAMSDTFSGYGTNESQVVQIAEDKLLVSVRNHRYKKKRSETKPGVWNPWAVSKTAEDRGQYIVTMNKDGFTWSELEWREDLPDPKCQAAIIRIKDLPDGRTALLFSNPANRSVNRKLSRHPMRINGTVRLSLDKGETWNWSKNVYGDADTGFGYSVMTQMDDGKIAIFFETDKGISIRIFDLDWLTDGEVGY